MVNKFLTTAAAAAKDFQLPPEIITLRNEYHLLPRPLSGHRRPRRLPCVVIAAAPAAPPSTGPFKFRMFYCSLGEARFFVYLFNIFIDLATISFPAARVYLPTKSFYNTQFRYPPLGLLFFFLSSLYTMHSLRIHNVIGICFIYCFLLLLLLYCYHYFFF